MVCWLLHMCSEACTACKSLLCLEQHAGSLCWSMKMQRLYKVTCTSKDDRHRGTGTWHRMHTLSIWGMYFLCMPVKLYRVAPYSCYISTDLHRRFACHMGLCVSVRLYWLCSTVPLSTLDWQSSADSSCGTCLLTSTKTKVQIVFSILRGDVCIKLSVLLPWWLNGRSWEMVRI